MKEMKDCIAISKVPALINELTGVTRTRQIVYHWAKYGRRAYDGRKIKLRTIRRLDQTFTTREWVEDFLRQVG